MRAFLRAIFLPTLLSLALPAMAQEITCPSELVGVVEQYRVETQELEELIKKSTVLNQIGVEPSTVFDLASHNCHNVPGQAYRVYSAGVCEKVEELEAVVRYDYKLFYRRADTVELMFKEEFKEGTDGILQVTFMLTESGWRQKSKRERLWTGEGDTDKHKDDTKNDKHPPH